MIYYCRDEKIFKRTTGNSWDKDDPYLDNTAWSDYDYEAVSIDFMKIGDEIVKHNDGVEVVTGCASGALLTETKALHEARENCYNRIATTIANHTDMEILNELKCKASQIHNEKCMKVSLPIMIPDESTPKGTICYGVCKDTFRHLFYFNDLDNDKYAGFLSFEYGRYLHANIFDKAEIDIEADLQFRAFLNATKEYKWFHMDEGGYGYVVKDKPEFDKVSQFWRNKPDGELGGLQVGQFSIYQPLWKDILIERKG